MSVAGRLLVWCTAVAVAPAFVAVAQDDASDSDAFGGFVVHGTSVEGRFVTFEADNSRQALRDFTVEGRPVFRLVAPRSTIGGFPLPEGEAGAALALGDEPGLRLYDNPSGLLVLRGPNPLGDPDAPEAHLPAVGTQFQLELADGVSATNESSRRLLLAWGEGDRGVLHSDRDVRLEGRDVFVQGSAVFVAHAAQALLPDASNVDRAAWQEGLAVGNVAAVVTIVRAGEGLAVETLAVRDATLVATQPEERHLRLTVNSTEAVPVVLALNLEEGLVTEGFTLRGFDPANASIQFPVRRASNLDDVLNPTDDGLLLEHRTVQATDGLHVMVSVPLLSPLVLDFAPTPPAPSPFRETIERPVVVAGVVAALLAVAVAVFTFFRRPSGDRMETAK